MKKIKYLIMLCILALSLGLVGAVSMSPRATVLAQAATTCEDGSPAPAAPDTCPEDSNSAGTLATPCSGGGSFLGFPKWYKYLGSQRYTDSVTGKFTCIPQVKGLNDIWRIVAAVIELLLRVGALIAIGFIVFGGISYSISQGSPDKTKAALKIIISALVGLVISIIATALVTFIAGRF